MAQSMTAERATFTGAEERSIQLRNVTKQFDDVTALNDINIDFAPQKINVLLGLSGSGKSTLLRHINGLHKPTSGEVVTLGTEVHRAGAGKLRKLRREVGMIFQHFHLVESMSVLENVCTGKLGSLAGPRLGLFMYPREVKEQAMEQLARVGLADKAFQRADALSGGQMQRVAIARALIQEPKVLLADEPVAALDPVSSATVMNLIGNIAKEDNLTVVCSLHQVEVALEFSDRIIGLRGGQLVMDRDSHSLSLKEAHEIYNAVAVVTEEEIQEQAPELAGIAGEQHS
ncbi:phosphonate ABC transporter ATP-binding protein [Nesterenkonia ebinurensis]|uniref:phosphonate ABC transporter ATP-binding protein n=1 Tax=Nesterenkonia ebinurensis TaxID=2608252 RepID=UPI001CC342CA|nr:phosphonate ABC transporter ATP-binding protein [Nesterenkonia ebinurensis]